MGYSEVLCHICGVSFNIGHIRTPNSPRLHAWDYMGHRGGISFVTTDPERELACPPEAECRVVFREDAMERQKKYQETGGVLAGHEEGATDNRSLKLLDESEEASDGAKDEEYIPGIAEGNGYEDVESMDYEFETPPETCAGSDIEMSDDVVGISCGTDESASDIEYREFVERLLEPQRIWLEHILGIENDLEYYGITPGTQHLDEGFRMAKSLLKKPEDEVMLPLYQQAGDDPAEYNHVAKGSNDEGNIREETGHDSDGKGIAGNAPRYWKMPYRDHRLNGSCTTDFDRWWEHIAGPGCEKTAGYSGQRITYEEMQWCNTFQCLIPKDEEWESDEEAEPWERNTGFFLSGLGEHMPSRDFGRPNLYPERGGKADIVAENVVWDFLTDEDCVGMPFHPSCLEVYKRACIKRFGRLEIDALTSWWKFNATSDGFNEWPRADAVNQAQEQWWAHNIGDEYLAADPCFVPKWSAELRSIGTQRLGGVQETTRVGSVTDDKQEATDQQLSELPYMSTCTSPGVRSFAAFPRETHRLIFAYLSTEDVAYLCTAIETLSYLGQPFLRDRLIHERPYLWELWSDMPYSRWTGTTSSRLKVLRHKFDQQNDDLRRMINVIKDEGYDNEAAAYEQYESDTYEERKSAPLGSTWMPKAALVLEPWSGDFIRLVKSLDEGIATGRMKGLENRARIWQDCEVILDDIERLKIEGEIMENGSCHQWMPEDGV